MRKTSAIRCGAIVAAFLLLSTRGAKADGVFQVPLENPSFTRGADRDGVPRGWSKYGGGGQDQELRIVDLPGGRKALLVADGDPTAEIGVVQTFPLKGGQTYQASAEVRAVEGAGSAGAYLQLRFLPSGQFVQTGLAAPDARRFTPVAITGAAPPGTTQGVIYLYTHREPTPRVLITDVRLAGGLPPPPPPPPPPVPPQYRKLKDLHLVIPLVTNGRPSAVVVVPRSGVYRAAAAAIQRAIQQRTGARLPVVSDDSAAAALPPESNLIVLGNRSTNRTMSALYDLFYSLVDLKYPGEEGYVVRTVHNPLGNGRSVVIVGGSDAAGVAAGAAALADALARAPATEGNLSIGWTMLTRLGRGLRPPVDIKDFQTWEASAGYGSIGYFGWCSISKRMAMYYMTGDRHSAREVVRLSFPDRQAIRDIENVDDERIENKHDPLAGFYHYNAHMAILFWDLIEESPLFTDEERLRITNAFARQLVHRKEEGVYGLTEPPPCVSSRHGQWAAIALYCLGRYFHKYYPDPVWAQCVKGGQLAFRSLHRHAWIWGESDNLYWYNTGIAPVLTYMVLTGDRKPLENGVLGELLRGQDILVSGRAPDWALSYASLGFLNQAAYLTGDSRWIGYRQRTGVDTGIFRLGQSFWPEAPPGPRPPADGSGKWSILRLPLPAWEARGSGLPWEQSFYFGSYRGTSGTEEDYVLLKGLNGASRNPYHSFDILELRLAGRTVLDGYHNQVLASADGLVEPAVAMDAALLASDVLGPTATAVGEVPKAAFSNWRRTLSLRTGRYAIVADDVTFRSDSRNMKLATTWQTSGGRWDRRQQAVRLPAGPAGVPGEFELRPFDVQDVSGDDVLSMNWTGAVRKNEHRIALYLIGRNTSPTPGGLACLRVADNAAALALPPAAVAVVGRYGRVDAQLAVLAEDHLYGRALSAAGLGDVLAASHPPVDLDWDFDGGVLYVAAGGPSTLRLRLAAPADLRVDGASVPVERSAGLASLRLLKGRYRFTGAAPDPEARRRLATALDRLLAEGRRRRAEALVQGSGGGEQSGRQLPGPLVPLSPGHPVTSSPGHPVTSSPGHLVSLSPCHFRLGGSVTAIITVPAADGARLCAAEGNSIHVLAADGREVRRLATDGKIRALHWWESPRLLLAGCADEKVIAFDGDGRRRWVFTSQMDPAVYEAAKTYWFKSAPGHEGIHGLSSGVFHGGASQCFVGSACTLEILDENGKLVKRTPVYWGPACKFLVVPRRDGSRDLLVAQWPNGSDDLAIVGSGPLAVTGRGYYGVPAGHTFVGGWTAQNRTALSLEDLDGDGKQEVVTAINGTWNRVTVYSEEGLPLANAQFGPGASSAPRAQIRDIDVADLNGDGKKELVVALSEGLVVALDGKCRKIWSARLSSAPLSVRCIPPRGPGQTRPARVPLALPVLSCDDSRTQAKAAALPGTSKAGGTCARRDLPWVVVGCDDGTVALLDAKGSLMRLGHVAGRPEHIVAVPTPAGPAAVVATDRGEVTGFQIGTP
jgi:hypothetical protein